MPERRAEHHLWIVVEYVFGAIAVMHVKIQDSHPLQLVLADCMCSSDRYIIKDTEP